MYIKKFSVKNVYSKICVKNFCVKKFGKMCAKKIRDFKIFYVNILMQLLDIFLIEILYKSV